jgi:hypothetical protein
LCVSDEQARAPNAGGGGEDELERDRGIDRNHEALRGPPPLARSLRGVCCGPIEPRIGHLSQDLEATDREYRPHRDLDGQQDLPDGEFQRAGRKLIIVPRGQQKISGDCKDECARRHHPETDRSTVGHSDRLARRTRSA